MAKKTVMVRLDAEFAHQIRWLAEHDRVVASKTARKPKTASEILKGLAGRSVSAAYAKIEPWAKSVQAAMEG